MKYIEGIASNNEKSQVKVNNDGTVDFKLVDQLLDEQEGGEYAFVAKEPVSELQMDDPIFCILNTYDVKYPNIKFIEDSNASIDKFDHSAFVTNDRYLYVSSSLDQVIEEIDFYTKRSALDLAKQTLKTVNEDSNLEKPYKETDKLLNLMVDRAIHQSTWQSLSTVFDDLISSDMVEAPEEYR